MKYIADKQDPWQASQDLAPKPYAGAKLTLTQWQSVRRTWPSDIAVGVALGNDEAVSWLTQDLNRLVMIALNFPKWTDGRAYSQARLLRSRLGFNGELRATGDVVVDMLPMLHRTGFDAVQLRADQTQATAERVLHAFKAHYQADVHDARPLHARANATATATTAR